MPRPYSMDLRERVIEAIAGGASRRETAEQFGLSASVVIIWAQRYHATGNIAPKPSGGSISPLEEHEDFILGLIKEQWPPFSRAISSACAAIVRRNAATCSNRATTKFLSSVCERSSQFAGGTIPRMNPTRWTKGIL